MRILKSNVLLRLVNSYVVDSPQPANINYLWNFGSLLAVCLVIQILTGVFLAMHYIPNTEFAFNSVEHIMRDVNNGWLLRYIHANVASFFFIFVYAHIGRGLYYSSYRSPRILVWSIGVIIFILMMANYKFWPNCEYDVINITYIFSTMLPINKSRTKAILRIGPHNKQILEIIICGLLGDFGADKISGRILDSIRIQVEQSIKNSAYIHYLSLYFYKLGYCAKPVPILIKKIDKNLENRFFYRLTLFTFSNFTWIYDSFYSEYKVKKVPCFIEHYLTPIGLAHWIMQDGSYQIKQGINIATNSFSLKECQFLVMILNNKYNLKTTVIKTGKLNQWRISIWKESLPILIELVEPHFIPEMKYKLNLKILV